MTPEQASPGIGFVLSSWAWLAIAVAALWAVWWGITGLVRSCRAIRAARRAEAADAEETDRDIDEALRHDLADALPLIVARYQHENRRRP